MNISLPENKKIYFASDNHLGAPSHAESRRREDEFIRWLDYVATDAGAIFLLGDLFDFWFEYKTVVPKGFVRTLGRLATLCDLGLPIYFFVGNHDLWMDDYFEKELGIPVYHQPLTFSCCNKHFLVGHGDGLGPGDIGYKRMKKVFTNTIAKWLFRWLHPDIGVRIAQHLSINNRLISGNDDVHFLGEDKEWLVQYCKRKLEQQHYDFFLFGHRHLPMKVPVGNNSLYINTGDWIRYFTYAEFNGEALELKKWNIT